MNFEKIALHVPKILLPRPDVDLSKWAVIACDQYTSQPEYWEATRKCVADNPSTLNLIFPEIYLGSAQEEQMVKNIGECMNQYFEEKILVPEKPGFVLVERQINSDKTRKGLMVALDLEQYSYQEGSQALIRSTEGTILDRLPPRIKIRKNSIMEVPHIMVLIDDPEKSVIEPLFEKELEQLCDFELMMKGGHLRSYKINQKELIDEIASGLNRLIDREIFDQKYSVSGKELLLYAMGDGNHSFATAKAIWEDIKEQADSPSSIANHPARYALVELVNIHDEGIQFEPIHRVLFNVNFDQMLQQMEALYQKKGCRVEYKQTEAPITTEQGHSHVIPLVTEQENGVLIVHNPVFGSEVGTLQFFLDQYLVHNSNVKLDYIHGDTVVQSLGSKKNNVGFYLPAMRKEDLFKTIIMDGALPQKSFSLGEPEEKRFYLECRMINPME
ncbi:MAG: DUF1015 domain-containing protein [SAR324 cluster bacterium]|nr:DUF1015 domain-containing protein [SAR324 cluster bacterium]